MSRNIRQYSIKSLIIATIVSSMGGFLFGYDNIVISGAIDYLTRYFKLDVAGTGWAAGCALVGCLIGSATSGAIVDRIGLKKGLYICAGCFAASSVGVWMSDTFLTYVIWRIVGGIGIGAASIIAPMYIAEIAPTRMRGRLVILYQLGIVLGILAAVFVNMLVQRSGSEEWNLVSGWKWMFMAGVVPAVLFLMAIIPAVESPRWLMKVGRREEALDVLTQINDTEIAGLESASIQESLTEEDGKFSELFTTGFRKALFIGLILAGLTQTSGITPLFSFLPEIFKNAGSATGDAFMQSVQVSVINMIFTIVAIWLIDKAGRRSLLLFGTMLQFFAFSMVGYIYLVQGNPTLVLYGVMAFVAAHAFGNGAVCWVIISEIFPTKVRGRAMSFATTALWVFAYLGNQVFPLMQKHLGNHGTFWVFASMALVNFFFVLMLVPETKGRSLEEIEKIFIKH